MSNISGNLGLICEAVTKSQMSQTKKWQEGLLILYNQQLHNTINIINR